MGRAWGRLPERSDFLRVAAQGIRQGTPAFLIQGAAQTPDSTKRKRLRVGFTASRKIGNSVVRNRAKRRLRAAVDLALSAMTDQTVDLVLVARHSAVSRDFATMRTELSKAADRVVRQLAQRQSDLAAAP